MVVRATEAKLRDIYSTPFQQVKREVVRHPKRLNCIYTLNGIHTPQVDGTANPPFTANRLQDINHKADEPDQKIEIENSASVMFIPPHLANE